MNANGRALIPDSSARKRERWNQELTHVHNANSTQFRSTIRKHLGRRGAGRFDLGPNVQYVLELHVFDGAVLAKLLRAAQALALEFAAHFITV